MGLRSDPGRVVNCHDLARVARIQRDHPDWSWADAAQHAEDQTAEYALLTHADTGQVSDE